MIGPGPSEEIAHWLHLIFCQFCVPAPTQEEVLRIVLLYQANNDSESIDTAEVEKAHHIKEILTICGVINPFIDSNEVFQLHGATEASGISGAANRPTTDSKLDSVPLRHGSLPPVGCPLPKNSLVCVNKTGPTPVVRLLSSNPYGCLLQLPKIFQLAFFRILIRLFTNEDDVEYRRYYEYGIEDELLRQVIHEPFVQRLEDGLEALKLDSNSSRRKAFPRRRPSVSSQMSPSSRDDAYGDQHHHHHSTKRHSTGSVFSEHSGEGHFYGWESVSASHQYTRENNAPRRRASLTTLASALSATKLPRNVSHGETTDSDKMSLPFPQDSRRDTLYVGWDQNTQNDETRNSINETGDTAPAPRISSNGSCLYSVVRFRCAPEWKNYLKASGTSEITDSHDAAVECLLNLVEVVVSNFDNEECDNSGHLIGPSCRLLGLMCTAGLETRGLKRLLYLATRRDLESPTRGALGQAGKENSNAAIVMRSFANLSLVRALTVAANERSPPSSMEIVHAAPRQFFTFNGGKGISLSTTTKLDFLPFSDAFGFAISFRVDPAFIDRSLPNPVLFNFLADDGRGVSTEFELVETNLMLVVRVHHDARQNPQVLRTTTHTFTPGKWYHIALQHIRTSVDKAYSNFFPKSKDEVVVYIDGALALMDDVTYPFVRSGDGDSPKPLVELGRNFLGQTGALRLFNKAVSAATITELYLCDAGLPYARAQAGQSNTQEQNDGKERSGAETSGLTAQDVQSRFLSCEQFLSWAPIYARDHIVVEPDRGWHGSFLKDSVLSWTKQCVQEVASSIGGVQMLLPLFQTALPANKDENGRLCLAGQIPCLLSLLASFVRHHENHALAMLQCKGIFIVECYIAESRQHGGLSVLRKSRRLSTETVNAITELCVAASSCHPVLELEVLSRLLFNITLWFGSDPYESGVEFYYAYLPVFCEAARAMPYELLRSVDLREILSLLCNLVETSRNAAQGNLANDPAGANGDVSIYGLPTIKEFHHIVDVIFGVVAIICVGHPQPKPLFHFLSYLLGPEIILTKGKAQVGDTFCNHGWRSVALSSACMLFLFLLRSSQGNVGQFESMFDRATDLAIWIVGGIEASSDDFVRAIFVRCMQAYAEMDAPYYQGSQGGDKGNSCEALGTSDIISSMFGVLRQHGKNTSDFSYNAIMNFLVINGPEEQSKQDMLDGLLVKDDVFGGGYRINADWSSSLYIQLSHAVIDGSYRFRSLEMIQHVLDLARLFPDRILLRFLSDFHNMLEASTENGIQVAQCRNWQRNLYLMISDAISDSRRTKEQHEFGDSEADRSYMNFCAKARMDLALKVYGRLLGDRTRAGGEEAFVAVEYAASLQSFHNHGKEIFCYILCYLFLDLLQEGILAMGGKENGTALRRSAETIITSITENGSKDLDFAVAVMHWRCLRHLVVFSAGAIVANGCGINILLTDDRFRKHDGIKFDDGATLSLSIADMASGLDERYRYACVAVAAQVLSVTDEFLLLSSQTAQAEISTGLALTAFYESHFGQAQGPLLVSLIRLSMLLLSALDPFGDAFHHNLFRLRRYLQWCVILSHQLKVMKGNSSIHLATVATVDRIFVSAVYLLYMVSGKCAAIPLLPDEADHFCNQRQKVLVIGRALRGSIFTVFKEKHDLLMLKLPRGAYDSMNAVFGKWLPTAKKKVFGLFVTQAGTVESPGPIDTEDSIRSFLRHASTWSRKFCAFINENPGRAAMIEELEAESSAIVKEFNELSNKMLGENKDADEYELEEESSLQDFRQNGSAILKSLSERFLSDRQDAERLSSLRRNAAMLARDEVLGFWTDTTSCWCRTDDLHWKLPECPDAEHRRILLVQNRSFDPHVNCAWYSVAQEPRRRTHRRVSMDLMKRASIAFHSELQKLDASTFAQHEEKSHATTQQVLLDAINEAESTSVEVTETLIEGPSFEADTLKEFGIELQDEEKIVQKALSIIKVSLGRLIEGDILLTNTHIYFRATSDETSLVGRMTAKSNLNKRSNRWKTNSLLELRCRKYLLRDCALEILFADSSSSFISFDSQKTRDNFDSKLRKSCKAPLLRPKKALSGKAANQLSTLTELWRKRKMSNFDYLMRLNILAGRSFCDLTQYPVMPWVLTDWTSDTLDLNDPRVYRDFSKPVGALNPDRLSKLMERYEDNENFAGGQSFMYGSVYSSPGIVLYFMIRAEPFTTLAVEFQSGKFDRPERLFSSMLESWNSCLQSTSDFKELIPELFTCPEVFVNCNGFDFGKTQEGRVINDVELPPWANGSAHEFIRLHRMALESEYVSENLHHWIDLVFGYKQRGKAAILAKNVFHCLSYDGYDVDAITDTLERQAAESHIQNFGQVPSQLRTSPHPSRYRIFDGFYPFYSEISPPKTFCCFTPPSQFGGSFNSTARGSVLNATFVTDVLLVVYADLHIGSYRFSEKPFGVGAFILVKEKLRELHHGRNDLDKVGPIAFAITTGGAKQEGIGRKTFQTPQPRILPGRGMGAVSSSARRLTKALSLRTLDSSSSEASVYILSCGYLDNSIKVHSAEAGSLEFSGGRGHRGTITCIGIGKQGMVVTGGNDATCRVWVLDHPEMVQALSDSFAGGLLSESAQLLVCSHLLLGHHSPISAICLSSELDVVVTGAIDNTICIHRTRSGEFVRFIHVGNNKESERGKKGVRRLAMDESGLLVVHTEDGMLHKSTINGAVLACVDARDTLNALQISNEGESLLSGGEKGHLLVRNLNDFSVIYMIDLCIHGPIRCISFTPTTSTFSRRCAFIGSDNGLVTVVYPEAPDDNSADPSRFAYIV